MIDPFHARRLVRALSVAAAGLLLAMVAITAATGVAQEPFERWRPDYADAIARAAPALRWVIGLDALFLIVYTALFVLLPRAVGGEREPLVRLGVGVLVAVAILDMVEDQHLLALAARAAAGQPLDHGAIALQHVASQVKFHLSYLGLALVALGLPRDRAATRWFAWGLGAPLPIVGAVQWAAPSLEGALDVARWLAFMSGFAGAWWLVGALRPAPGADAAATGARA